MNLPPLITPEIYQRAVEFEGRWRPGQRCETGEQTYPHTINRETPSGWHSYCFDCRFDYTAAEYEALGSHDIPLPPLTDELLMHIFKFGLKERGMDFYTKFDRLMRFVTNDPAAAIILAAASMEPK